MSFLDHHGAKSLLLAAWLAMCAGTAAAADPSPVGLWRTVDDRTGQQAGLIEIRQSGDELEGRIVDYAAQADDPSAPACRSCSSASKAKLVPGLTILRGFRRDGDVWDGGTILDPRSGFVYRCELRVTDGGRKLLLRGYLLIRLLGRTTTWERAE